MAGRLSQPNRDDRQRIVVHDGEFWLADDRGLIEPWRNTPKYVVLDRSRQPSRRGR